MLNCTYHVDATVSGDGDDRVKGTEINAYSRDWKLDYMEGVAGGLFALGERRETYPLHS